jgi:mono/diheme cytochrome c family protein
MMSASALCTDDVASARAIDEDFPDVRAYLLSLEAPPYPYAVDAALADDGRAVFEATCSGCHGTYGARETYPNLLVPLDAVGTDPVLAEATRDAASPQVEWFNGSFYGEIARIEPTDGYLAPPLDGIWATGPYLHNASVPTLAAVLDPALRPDRWVRVEGYDPDDVGVAFELADRAKDEEPDPALRARIYDTARPGYGNGGHPFGAPLAPDERAAVLEYLKTL